MFLESKLCSEMNDAPHNTRTASSTNHHHLTGHDFARKQKKRQEIFQSPFCTKTKNQCDSLKQKQNRMRGEEREGGKENRHQ